MYGARRPNAHGVLGRATEALDAQVVTCRLEEEIHLPAALVEGVNQYGQQSFNGQEHQALVGVRIAMTEATERRGVLAGGIEAVEEQPAAAIDCRRVHALPPRRSE